MSELYLTLHASPVRICCASELLRFKKRTCFFREFGCAARLRMTVNYPVADSAQDPHYRFGENKWPLGRTETFGCDTLSKYAVCAWVRRFCSIASAMALINSDERRQAAAQSD